MIYVLFDVQRCAINDINFKMICRYGITTSTTFCYLKLKLNLPLIVLNITFETLIMAMMLSHTKMAKRQQIFIALRSFKLYKNHLHD